MDTKTYFFYLNMLRYTYRKRQKLHGRKAWEAILVSQGPAKEASTIEEIFAVGQYVRQYVGEAGDYED